MKKVKLIVAALACLMISAVCFADGKFIPVDQLPQPVKTFVQTNFPEQSIIYAELETDAAGTTYEVKLNDGTELDFDKKGNWEKIDCKMVAVPAAFIPQEIAAFVKNSYPGALIVKIKKDRIGWEAETSNGLELKFNKKFQLVAIDD